MSMLGLSKRLASGVLHHGKKVWLGPHETNVSANANSHQQIWKLIKGELVIREPVTIHSWTQWQKSALALPESQACGHREVKGYCQCRMRRIRILCWLLRRCHESRKTDHSSAWKSGSRPRRRKLS